jgi:hypothetical protein
VWDLVGKSLEITPTFALRASFDGCPHASTTGTHDQDIKGVVGDVVVLLCLLKPI